MFRTTTIFLKGTIVPTRGIRRTSIVSFNVGRFLHDNNSHAGGNNSVNPAKTLKLEALTKYEKDSVEKIMTQVRNGAGAMPPFDDLTDEEVNDVANFVFNQATNDSW